jgi:hypothetical protein
VANWESFYVIIGSAGAALPFVTYASLTAAALFLRAGTASAPFVVAAASLGLLLIGIHNSWDSVTHLVAGDGAGDLND